jgi:protein phosphatase 1 regulatory subunit 37
VEGFEISPTTPKIDKGKGKAEPESEEPEKVHGPRIYIAIRRMRMRYRGLSDR